MRAWLGIGLLVVGLAPLALAEPGSHWTRLGAGDAVGDILFAAPRQRERVLHDPLPRVPEQAEAQAAARFDPEAWLRRYGAVRASDPLSAEANSAAPSLLGARSATSSSAKRSKSEPRIPER